MLTASSKPLVVGIAGGSASGKSTLAQRLVQALDGLGVEVLGMDRYFRHVRPKMVAPVTRVVYDDHNHPESFDLVGLVRDLDALLAREDRPQVVIVEGLMTLYDEQLRTRLDLKIFLDAQSDERIVRRLRRNMARGAAFDDIATFFLDSVRYRHQEFVEPSRWHADIVLNGSNTSERGVTVLVEWIRQHAPVAAKP
jgi:uridine kinase